MRLQKMLIQVFFYEKRHFLRRIYWTLAISLLVLLFVVPLTLALRSPDVDIFGDDHSRVFAQFREVFTEARQVTRTNQRIQDFSVMLWLLNENYPFLDMAERGGVDLLTLAEARLADMEEEAYHWAFDLVSFTNERFFNEFDRLGNVRLISEPRGDTEPWMMEPYFFGYRDWRFTSAHWDMGITESNFAAGYLDDGVAYLQITSFMEEGFDRPRWESFRHFYFEEERAALLAFFTELDAESLVIDIRGVHSGFGDYFVPLLLEPNLHEPMSGRFYAMHSAGDMAMRVSEAFRDWYGWDAKVARLPELPYLNETDAEFLHYSFAMNIDVAPMANAETPLFAGQMYLLVDSGAFSGPNFMYLQLAQDAGWRILYYEDATAAGWGNSYVVLPHSRFNLRFNPLYFTDAYGRSFEEMGAFYHARVSGMDEVVQSVVER